MWHILIWTFRFIALNGASPHETLTSLYPLHTPPANHSLFNMIDYDNVCFNIASFIGGLFVLEFGADKFIDHTAKVAARLRIPPTLIALLTAGAEWEEVLNSLIALVNRFG